MQKEDRKKEEHSEICTRETYFHKNKVDSCKGPTNEPISNSKRQGKTR